MATGTPGTTARQYSLQVVHYLRKGITFADGGKTVDVGILPAGAVIVKPISGVAVSTVFDAGTLNIGIDGTPAKYGSALALSALAYVPIAAAVSMAVDVDTPITAAVTGAPTAGAAEIIIAYVVDNDG